MSDEEIKMYMRDKICPKCLEKLKEENPYLVDCALHYKNDEHLCNKANRLKR